MNKLFTKIATAVVGFAMAIGVGVAVANTNPFVAAHAADATYTFTNKSWAATLGGSSANWTKGKDGNGFSNNGIQVTTGTTGANGTSPTSYTNITQIVLTYNTNKSAGNGTFDVKVGDNAATSKEWKYSGNENGTSARFTTTFDYNTPQTGNVKITVNTTTNSCYLVSCKITTSGGGGDAPTLASISVKTAPTKVTYTEGEYFAPAGLVITKRMSDSTSGGDVDYNTHSSDFTFSPTTSTALTTSHTSVTITYGGKSTSQSITVNPAFNPTGTSYKRITSVDGLIAGKTYVIGNADGTKFMSSTQNTNNREEKAATSSNNVVSYASGMEVLTLGGSTGAWTFYANMSTAKGYLYSASSASNHLKTQSTNNANGQWAITFSDGTPSVVSQGTNTHNIMRHNSSSKLFSSYDSTSSTGAVSLWKILEAPTSYTISYDSNGGGEAPTDSTTYTASTITNVTLQGVGDMAKTGYTCDGWATSPTGDVEYELGASGQDLKDLGYWSEGAIVLYAHWTINSYTVSFNIQGHGTAPDSQNIDYGGKVTKPSDPSADGYIFKGWYKEPGCVNEWDFANDTISGVTTIYASWVVSYVVTFDVQGHGTAPDNQIVEHAGKVTQPSNPTATGYTFGGWYKESECLNAWDFANDTVTSTTIIYAKWTVITYNVTFNVQGHGTAPANQLVDYGEKITEPADPTEAGFSFDGWYKESGCLNAWDFANDTVSGNTILYALWTDIRTVVTLSAEDMAITVGEADKAPIITSAPTGHTSGYSLTSDTTSVATIINNKVHGVAKGTATITVHIENTTEYRFIDTTFTVTVTRTMDDTGTGTINFGSASGNTSINAASVTGDDSQHNTWTITTVGTTSYTQDASYSQVGSKTNPATSITFTTTLSKNVMITDFSAKFGGFASTAGSVTLKIGDSTVATGSLNETSDVIVGGDITDTSESTVLTVTITDISRGVKVYYISYSYEAVVHVESVSLSEEELNLVPGGTYQLEATVLPDNATNKNVTWSVIDADPTGCITVDSTGLVTAVEDGTATVKVTTADGSYTDTCAVTVSTPVGAYVNIVSSTAIGIVDGDTQEINFAYGGTFSGALGVVSSNSNVGVTLTDNGDGTGKVTISFVSAGTSVISFVDGDDPIENDGSTCTVTIVEKLAAINSFEDYESYLTYTAAYSGNEKTNDNISWTVNSDGPSSTYDDTKGIHYGTNKSEVQYITLTSGSSYSDIAEISVNASTASGGSATVSVTVGGVAFGGSPQALSSSAATYTFTGPKASGVVVITITKDSSSTGALYCKSFSVTGHSSITTNIANTNAVVQQEVLNFVSVMNTDLSVCSGSATLSTSVWAGLAEKFETAATTSTNEDLFRQMFKFADATPRAGDGSATTGDSLQNALARYNYVLEKYGTASYEDFLHRADASKVTPKSALSGNIFGFVINNSNMASIIVIISMISIAAVGGYFFLRKRKED